MPRKKVYAEDFQGKKIQDIWKFKDTQSPMYPTQKNNAMLKRIIQMFSNVDSLVMDYLCGSGGFLRESFLLGRNFIGIDESKEAIKINQQNLCKCEYGFLKNIRENVRDSKDQYIPK